MCAPLEIPHEVIQQVFLNAMTNSSWVSGGQKWPGSEPNLWQVIYDDGPWHVIDQWSVAPGTNNSFGSVIIYFENIPVWMMQFHGEYDQECGDFVKLALLDSYRRREFRAGRGRNGFQNEKLVYLTTYYQPASFASFNFLEEVYDFRTDERLGWHRVSGMALI